MIDKTQQAEFVKNIRDKSRLSQRAFARALDVSAAYIGQVETEASYLSEKVYRNIIEKFGHLANDNSEDCISLDYFPEVFGSCGTGVFVPSEQKEKISLSKESISNYSVSAQYSVINAIGDSMTPYIHNMDKLIVKHWEGEQIKDNSVYVFRYLDEIFVKRLSKNIDQIVIKSDNPIYDTRKIPVSKDFQIIGQIVGLLRDMR